MTLQKYFKRIDHPANEEIKSILPMENGTLSILIFCL